jgi:hypothetical protein
MRSHLEDVSTLSREDGLRSRRRRQVAKDERIAHAFLHFYHVVLGRPPRTIGWQFVIPKPKNSVT